MRMLAFVLQGRLESQEIETSLAEGSEKQRHQRTRLFRKSTLRHGDCHFLLMASRERHLQGVKESYRNRNKLDVAMLSKIEVANQNEGVLKA